jgi:hypothetical protein
VTLVGCPNLADAGTPMLVKLVEHAVRVGNEFRQHVRAKRNLAMPVLGYNEHQSAPKFHVRSFFRKVTSFHLVPLPLDTPEQDQNSGAELLRRDEQHGLMPRVSDPRAAKAGWRSRCPTFCASPSRSPVALVDR